MRICATIACLTLSLSAQCLNRPTTTVPGVSLTIAAPAKSYVLGEIIKLHLSLSNASGQTHKRLETDYEYEFEVQAVGPDGAPAQLTDYGRKLRRSPFFATLANDVDILPGSTVEVDEDISKIYQFAKPGSYHLSACTNFHPFKGEKMATIGSNELTITVNSRVGK